MSSVSATAPAQDRPTPGVSLKAVLAGQEQLLPPGALALLVSLHRAIEPERRPASPRAVPDRPLRCRALPDFRDDTRELREGDWTVAPIPPRCRTAASRSPARPTRRWSSTRSTPAPGVHGRLRGFDLADLANLLDGQAALAARCAATSHTPRQRQALRARPSSSRPC
jgi:hypothetical protein